MCILFAYINPKPEPGGYKIILASNRDESLSRPAKPAHEWPNYAGVYGGKLLKFKDNNFQRFYANYCLWIRSRYATR